MRTRHQEKSHHRQLEANLQAFSRELPRLLSAHEREFVLLHDAQIVGFFSTAASALREGVDAYGKGQFSIQRIARSPANLGVHSYTFQGRQSAGRRLRRAR